MEKEGYVLTPSSYEAVKRLFLATTASSDGRKRWKEMVSEYGIQEYLFSVDSRGHPILTAARIIEDFRRTLVYHPDFDLWFTRGSSFKKERSAKTTLSPARWLCHLTGFRHLAAHLFLAPGDNEHILVQVRGTEKAESPASFDVPVAGHVEAGLTEQEAVLREAKEELGLEADALMNLTAIGGYEYKDPDSKSWIRNVEFRRVFKATLSPSTLGEVRPAREEVAAIALFSISAIESLIEKFPERVASGLRLSMPIYRGCGSLTLPSPGGRGRTDGAYPGRAGLGGVP